MRAKTMTGIFSLLLAPCIVFCAFSEEEDQLAAEDAAVEAAGSAVMVEDAGMVVEVPLRPDQRIRYFYHRGLDAFGAKDYRVAIECFDEVVALDPAYRRADYYRREAWNQVAAGSIPPAAETEEVLVDDLRSEFDSGCRAMQEGRYGDAIGSFQAVLRVNPSHNEARRLLGEARLHQERQSLAEEEALAEQLMREEAQLRTMAQEEEDVALRRAYDEGRTALEQGELEQAESRFTDIRRSRGQYRRTDYFLRRLDHEIQRKQEVDLAVSTRDALRQYTLGPEDEVRVIVRNHPEFSFNANVEEGGELIIPLTNEIIVADGLTRDELAEELRKRLTAYIDDPFVKVFIQRYGSKKFYVLQPTGGGSEYIMDKANMTLWDCMFMAGIPILDSAALRRIQVITPHPTHPTHRWINVYSMLYQGKMQDNIRVEPGTIIYYPMLAIDKFSQIVKKITKPVSDLASLGDSYEDWDSFRKKYLR